MKPELQRRVQRYGWDKAAAYYEHSWQKQLQPAHDLLLSKTNIQPSDHILDIAAGTGLLTFRMHEQIGPQGKIIATDISDEMVKIGSETVIAKHLKNVTFERMDAENLNISSESIDLVTCALGLMYLPDPDKCLSEIYKVLKPSGRVVVAIWGSRKNCGWAEIFPIVDARVSSDVCPMFFNLGESNVLQYTFEKAGFNAIEIAKIETLLHYSTADEACKAAFLGGPVALAYSRFDETTKTAAKKEYLDSIASYKTQKGYEILGEFVIGSAIKN
ncbi:class I SAM-dependent methyltransferase [Flavobacterium chuncheonense]|uniref:Class I SAM-dependent methyltransferase n=1 Tax=Flavobacterium chuncheonense TaxID=2026653 RepID=A0ABW5YP02_9FLAO